MTWLVVLAALNAAVWMAIGLAARRDQEEEQRILAGIGHRRNLSV